MARRDLNQNRHILLEFKGRRCFMTLATNSIRFRIDEAAKKAITSGFDPAWVTTRDQESITSSDEYSENCLKRWCQLFDALRETVLEGSEEGADGALTLVFPGGYRAFRPDRS